MDGTRGALLSSSDARRQMRLAPPLRQTLGEEVEDDADARGVAEPFVGQQPQADIVSRQPRQAHDEVGVEVGDDRRQHGEADAGADRGEQARGRAVLDGDGVEEAVALQPGAVDLPRDRPAAADEDMACSSSTWRGRPWAAT